MTTNRFPKLGEWITEIEKIDTAAASYLRQKKWSKAINALFDRANFGLLTPEKEFKEKRKFAVAIYQLSKDIRNTKGKGLALSLLARHLIKDQDYELAYRLLLLTKDLLTNGMEWIGVKEVYNLFPKSTLEMLRNRNTSFNDDSDSLAIMFIEKYGL